VGSELKDSSYKLAFYVAYPYYFPHFLPIFREAEKRGWSTLFILSEKQNSSLMRKIAEDENINYIFGDENIFEVDTEYIFFGTPFQIDSRIKAKRVFLCHGIGTKECGFEKALERDDLVFVEGRYREEKYKREFPEYADKIKAVGYSKFDALKNINREELLRELNLDINRRTVLYSPTFYPSSIENMSKKFPEDLKNYNLIIKPHYLTFERSRDKKQRKLLNIWSKYENITIIGVEHQNLLPYLSVADLMISDESSAVFEFASLNKPVILNRFIKLRWSYLLNPKKLLNRIDSGMDRYREVATTVDSYRDMLKTLNSIFSGDFKVNPSIDIADVSGLIDGKVSERICNILEESY